MDKQTNRNKQTNQQIAGLKLIKIGVSIMSIKRAATQVTVTTVAPEKAKRPKTNNVVELVTSKVKKTTAASEMNIPKTTTKVKPMTKVAIKLNRAERNALGLERDQEIYDLTPKQRKMLASVEAKPKAKVVDEDVEADDETALPIKLTLAERNALGLTKGQKIYDLTKAQRLKLKGVSAQPAEEEAATPIKLTMAERNLLGFEKGQKIYKLTVAQRKALAALDSGDDGDAGQPLTDREKIKELNRANRELQKALNIAQRKLDRVFKRLASILEPVEEAE